MRQAIIRTNDGTGHRRIYAALGLNELIFNIRCYFWKVLIHKLHTDVLLLPKAVGRYASTHN